jgi:translation initiation factor IF-3
VPQVRCIGADGGQLGVLDTSEALRIAEESGLDLVEVSPKAMPPVCKIMDYGKFKYEDSKKKKEAKKHQSTVTLKEIKFRPKTDDHDLDFKVKHIRRFLLEGNKAKLVVIFRGREIVHPETGQAMLKRVVELTSDIAMVEQNPMMEGRRMLMIIAPRGGVINRPTTPTSSPSPTAAAPAPRPAAPAPTSAPSASSASSASPITGHGSVRPAGTQGPSSQPRPAVQAKPQQTGPTGRTVPVTVKPPAK